jgi:hypothetical protein
MLVLQRMEFPIAIAIYLACEHAAFLAIATMIVLLHVYLPPFILVFFSYGLLLPLV